LIERHKDKVIDWGRISECQELSEGFIEKYKDKVNWGNIVMYQKISEGFIERHINKMLMEWIIKYQKISEGFIERHKDKINMKEVGNYQKLSKEFRKKYGIKVRKRNWLYLSEREKEEYIRERTPFEIKEDEGGKYIEAYKATRRDGYSYRTFRYRYEVGKEYESQCDCDMRNRGSFGLSGRTREYVSERYPKGRVFKVKIYIRDIGAVINGEVRCFKLKVIGEVID